MLFKEHSEKFLKPPPVKVVIINLWYVLKWLNAKLYSVQDDRVGTNELKESKIN